MNEIVHAKGRLGRVNVNVVKVQNKKSRMLEERVIGSRRKLPAETNNGELLLFLFIAIANARYQRRRLPCLDTLQCGFQSYVVWVRFVVYVFEYRDFHFLSQS